MTILNENENISSGERRVQFIGTADDFLRVELMVDGLNSNLGSMSIGNLLDEIGDEGRNLAIRGRTRTRKVLGLAFLDVIHEIPESEEGNGNDGYDINGGNEDDEGEAAFLFPGRLFIIIADTSKNKSSALDSNTDGTGSLFSCPICDFDVELPVLYSHLQEEHCFDLENAVCPVCAANLGKDPVEHLTLQHPNLLKRRRKSDKPSIWYGNSAMLSKKLAIDSRGNKNESAPDPLLSPFVCSVSAPNPNSVDCNEPSINNATVISNANSSGTNAPNVGDEQDHQERREKAVFIQQLVASTIF